MTAAEVVLHGAPPARGGWWGTTWRQYRLERKMFWRNPSAAFFGVLLPLLLLVIFGAVFAGDHKNLDVIVPGIAGMSVMSATFISLAYNLTNLRERGILKRLRGTPLPPSAYIAGLAANAVANAALQLAIVIVAGRLVVRRGLAVGLGVARRVRGGRRRLLRAARRGARARHPQPGVRARLRQRGLPAAAPAGRASSTTRTTRRRRSTTSPRCCP